MRGSPAVLLHGPKKVLVFGGWLTGLTWRSYAVPRGPGLQALKVRVIRSCYVCEHRATCFGSADIGVGDPGFLCNVHCAHTQEDGRCVPC